METNWLFKKMVRSKFTLLTTSTITIPFVSHFIRLQWFAALITPAWWAHYRFPWFQHIILEVKCHQHGRRACLWIHLAVRRTHLGATRLVHHSSRMVPIYLESTISLIIGRIRILRDFNAGTQWTLVCISIKIMPVCWVTRWAGHDRWFSTIRTARRWDFTICRFASSILRFQLFLVQLMDWYHPFVVPMILLMCWVKDNTINITENRWSRSMCPWLV